MDDLKTCINCKLTRNYSDFMMNREECYKCEYQRKLKTIIEKKKKKECKLCFKTIPEKRWTYCSVECAKEAKRRHRHWTNKFRMDTKDWKKRFMGIKF